MIIREPEGFGALSKADQIRYVQALWDRITEDPENIPAPSDHVALAEERLHACRRNPERAQPAHEALDRLAKGER